MADGFNELEISSSFMITFDLGLLALVHPIQRGSIESWTHAGVLNPGIPIVGGALDYRWTASLVSPSIFLYGEASLALCSDREAAESG